MSRRDTVIIAILLNAGLLIILFTTSLRPEKVEQPSPAVTVIASHQPQVAQEIVTKAVVPSAVSHDPLDEVIEHYITPNIPLQQEAIPSSSQEGHNRLKGVRDVIVKKGDVLEKIAKQYHVTVSDIIELNQLSSTNLKIGQVLKLPAPTKVAAAASSLEEGYYIVKAGDNPWTIAVKHRIKVEDLLRLNQLNEESAKRLKTGDKLRIK
ncbi:MAG: LysM peptidoglycan-binding domain-containing protein [Candidatus Rhabdochlamydia sp.]